MLLCVSITCAAHATSFTPRGEYAEGITEELSSVHTRFNPESITKLNLQNKPLAFASKQYIFDYELADKLIDQFGILPNLEVLDLSLNRLPTNALPYFLPLLRKPHFKFLDVRINSGANSLEGLRELSEEIHRIVPPISIEQERLILQKIIWLSEDFLDRVNIPEIYKESHREYFRKALSPSSSTWTLP